jgi:hypothetical protein
MTGAQTFAQPPRFVDVKSKRADNDWYQDQPDPHVLLVLGRLLWQGEPS